VFEWKELLSITENVDVAAALRSQYAANARAKKRAERAAAATTTMVTTAFRWWLFEVSKLVEEKPRAREREFY